MIFNRKIILIVIILFSSFLTISSISNTNKTQSTDSYFIYSNQVNLVQARYSTDFNSSNNIIHFYTISRSDKQIFLSTQTINNLIIQYSNVASYPINYFSSNSLNIVDFNYFISNNTKFVAMSLEKSSTNYLINITNLNNNNTFTLTGTSAYYISNINVFSGSTNVYFSIYNSTNFSIVKWDFGSGTFSIFYSSANTSSPYFITNIKTTFLDNKLYVLKGFIDTTDSNNINSTITTFNQSGLISTKFFGSFLASTFTIIENGFILYSAKTNQLSYYLFDINSATSYNVYYYGYQLTPDSDFQPFTNNSFLILKNNYLRIVQSNDMNPTYVNLVTLYSYNLTNSSWLMPQTYNLAKGNYYTLGKISVGQLTTITCATNEVPYIFNPEAISTIPDLGYTDITYPNTARTTPSQSTSTNVVGNNPQNSNYVSTQYSLPTQSSDAINAIILVIIGFLAVFGFYTYKNDISNSINRYRNRFNSSNSSNNIRLYNNYENMTQNSQSSPSPRNSQPTQAINSQRNRVTKSFCSYCGGYTESTDIFCQNCGNRL